MRFLAFFALLAFLAKNTDADIDPWRSALQKKIRITTLPNVPYVIEKVSSDGSNTTHYAGFLIDILDEVSRQFPEFKYKIQIVRDGSYGMLKEDGTWSGMIGEVMRNEADVAMCDLTMTEYRARVIEFTVPFLRTGISMMVKRSDNQNSDGYQTAASTSYIFLWVFSWQMWLCLLVVLLAFSILYHLGNKFTSDTESQTGILGELCLSLGALTIGQNKLSKKSISVRFLTIVWKLFVLFTIGLYLSSLTTAMWARFSIDQQTTSSYAKSPENIVKEAMTKGYPKIITINKGSSQSFFKNSPIPEYQLYGRQAASNPEFQARNTADGVAKVKSGGHLFMLESTSNEYITNRDCELEQLPQLINTISYGMALRRESPITPLLNVAILRLQETSQMDQLKKKWWTADNLECDKNSASISSPGKSSFSSLHPGDVSGLFYTLIGATALVILAIFTEFVLKRKRSKPGAAKKEDKNNSPL